MLHHVQYSCEDTVATRIIGRCVLPFQTTERSDQGFDLMFQVRSNFGGLRKSFGVGLLLHYKKREKQWVLRVKDTEQPTELQLPLWLQTVPDEEKSSQLTASHYHLVKPNKHFLKQHGRSVVCRGGVLTIPILLINENQSLLEGTLDLFPAVIKGKEYLVVHSTDLPLVVSR